MIDTLRVAGKSMKSGFERQQAEGVVRVLGDELDERMTCKPELEVALGLLEVFT